MKAYVLVGYTNEDNRCDNRTFGAYTNRERAENELIRITREAFDKIDKYNRFPCDRECRYTEDGKLWAILDNGGDYEVFVRIETVEIVED